MSPESQSFISEITDINLLEKLEKLYEMDVIEFEHDMHSKDPKVINRLKDDAVQRYNIKDIEEYKSKRWFVLKEHLRLIKKRIQELIANQRY